MRKFKIGEICVHNGYIWRVDGSEQDALRDMKAQVEVLQKKIAVLEKLT